MITTLSKYRNVLFSYYGKGKWYLLHSNSQIDMYLPKHQSKKVKITSSQHNSEYVRHFVAKIQENDIVYTLLKKTHHSLSFAQICQKIAEMGGFDWHELKQTGFLNAQDARIVRLDNGQIALREWFDPPISATTSETQEINQSIDKQAYLFVAPKKLFEVFSKIQSVIYLVRNSLLRFIKRISNG